MIKKAGTISLALAIALGATSLFSQAHAASATATAKQRVKSAIKIVNDSDLDFGEAEQGADALEIAPSDAGAAQFSVSGQKNTAYSITLPESVTMTVDGGGSADKEIQVTSFTSDPTGTGDLGETGTQELHVGATRAALSATQEAGDYTGSFEVTVVYQP